MEPPWCVLALEAARTLPVAGIGGGLGAPCGGGAMEELQTAVRELTEKLSAVEESVSSINSRLESEAGRRRVTPSAHAAEPELSEPEPRDSPAGIDFGSYSDLQAEFRSVRDAVSKVKLPQDLIVGDSRAGARKADLARFQVIQKCARFQETVLKILSAASVSDPIINQLTTVALAQIRYLQEEYTNLLVSNQFDDSTAQLFKTLQQNPAAFTPGAVENLQRAVTIAGARQQSRQVSQAPDRARWRGPPPPAQRFGAGPASADWRSRGRPGPGYPALSRDWQDQPPPGAGAGPQ